MPRSDEETQEFDDETGLFVPRKSVPITAVVLPVVKVPKEKSPEPSNPSAEVNQPEPAADSNVQKINIFVRLQDGNTQPIGFRVAMHKGLEKLISTSCERFGITRNLVRFLYDGNRVLGTTTPANLEIEDGDYIEIMSEQVAG